MRRSYLKIALRNLRKHRGYALLNIMGLACGILILLFVPHELSYGRHHAHAERIYRVGADLVFGGTHFQLAVTPAPLAEALVNDFPEVVSAASYSKSRPAGQGANKISIHFRIFHCSYTPLPIRPATRRHPIPALFLPNFRNPMAWWENA